MIEPGRLNGAPAPREAPSAPADRALRDSEARLRALVEHLPLAMQVFGPDGRTLRVNPAWERMWHTPFAAMAEYNVFQDRQLEALGVLACLRRAFEGAFVELPLHGYDKSATDHIGPEAEHEGKLWIRGYAYPVRGESGEVLEVVVVQEDVTEPTRNQEALVRSEGVLRESQKIAGIGSWELDLGSDTLYWSDEVYKLFGLEPQAFGATYEAFLDRVHPEDRAAVDAAYRTSLREGRDAYEIEHRIVQHGTGAVRYVHEKCRHLRDASGAIIRSVGTVHDITERRMAEDQRTIQHDLVIALAGARDLEEGLDLCLDSALRATGLDCGGIYLLEEADGGIRLVAHRGICTQEFIRSVEHYPSGSAQVCMLEAGRPAYARYEELGLPLSDVQRREGMRLLAVIPMHFEGRLIGALNMGSHVVDDLGEAQRQTLETIAAAASQAVARLQTQVALRRSEEKFRGIFDDSVAAIYVFDAERRFLESNQAGLDLLGYSREELLRLSIPDVDADPSAVRPAHEELLAGHRLVNFEHRLRRKDGTVITVLNNSRALTDLAGRVVGIQSTLLDITARTRAEVALRASEAQFSAIFHGSHDGIILADPVTMRFQLANEAMGRMLGYAPGELVGLAMADIHPVEALPLATAAFERRRAGEVSIVQDLPLRRRDGTTMYADMSSALITIDGATLHAGFFRDITERRRHEAERDEALSVLQTVIQAAPVRIFWKDRESRYLGCNPLFATDAGRTGPEEVVGRSDQDLAWSEQAALYKADDRAVMETGEAKLGFEEPQTTPDGMHIVLRTSKVPLRDGQGEVFGILGVYEDITERRQAVEEIRRLLDEAVEREFFLRQAQQVGQVGGWRIELPAGRMRWTEGVYGITELPLGYEPTLEEAFGVYLPDSRQRLEAEHLRACETGEPFALQLQLRAARSGATKWVQLLAQPHRGDDGQVDFLVGTIQDISRQKEQESAYQSLFEGASDGIFLAEEGGFVDCNARGAELFDLPREQILGRRPEDFSPERQPDGRLSSEVSREHIRRAMAGEPQLFEWQNLAVGRRAASVEITLSRINLRGKPFLQAIVRDITERKRAEDALRASEARFRAVVQGSHDGIILLDPATRKVAVANEAMGRMLGYDEAELVGLDLEALHPSGELPRVLSQFDQLSGKEGVFLPNLPMRRKDGSVFFADLASTPVRSDGEVYIAGFFRDVTERRQLEEERLRSQKLESIGTLAGGIAHDFNNLLQGLFGFLSLAKLNRDDPAQSLSALEQAETALHMAVRLTTQLLTFSKGGQPITKTIDLQPVVTTSARFALSGSASTFHLSMDPDLWKVQADEGQLGQVFQNIVLNASQAMPDGGVVEVAARNLDAARLKASPNPAVDRWVEVTVTDSGVGIPGRYLDRIFDPYFTTKERGSGLGLATSYSIIRNHGGTIEVRSEPGQGTEFRILLPAAAPEAVQEARPAAAPATRRKGRILVMDDDELVRNVARALLRKLGHETVAADRGETAVECYRSAMAEGRPFDVVLLDLTVKGGMGGEGTLAQLLAMDPQVKAVVSSGYAEGFSIEHFKEKGFAACLSKPYSIAQLDTCLGGLLA